MVCISHSINAQIVKTSSSSLTTETSVFCPDGTNPTVSIFINTLNFHKPRTSCTGGFGLCIKLTVSVFCASPIGKSYIKGDQMSVSTKLTNQTAELHFPIALKYEKGFEKADLSTFEIEDKSLSFKTAKGLEKLVKGGIYPVSVIGDEFVVTLNLY